MLDEWRATNIRQRCQLVEKLGEGTYGHVYAGRYRAEAAGVAVKISLANRLHLAVDATEIAVLLKLQGHPNVIALREYFFSPYFAVLVMRKMDESVYTALKRRSSTGGLQPDIARYISRMIACGVGHMHEMQLLHRDLHAGNVLLTLHDGNLTACSQVKHVCIADFGQSCDIHSDKPYKRRSARKGAQQILPPECALVQGNAASYDKPADIWAIGVNLVLMVGGLSAMPCGEDGQSWVRACAKLLGSVDPHLCARHGWTIVPTAAGVLRPVALRGLHGGEAFSDHLEILHYDPALRPTAANLVERWP